MSISRRVTMSSIAAAIALTALALTGCSATAPSAQSGIEVSASTVIIDVRTPAEFASGHLDGAINIDVQSADFEARVNQLDPAADHIVYCKSGNRAGQAVARMEQLGFESVVNAGSVSSASQSTGIAVVTD